LCCENKQNVFGKCQEKMCSHSLFEQVVGWVLGNIFFFLFLTNIFLFSVIQSLIALVHEPEPGHPLRPDLAEEYTRDKKKFYKNADEYTKKHSEKRPTD